MNGTIDHADFETALELRAILAVRARLFLRETLDADVVRVAQDYRRTPDTVVVVFVATDENRQ